MHFAKSNNLKNKHNIIGLMSGTSLDGIDVAYCSFDRDSNQYSISHCESIPYSKTWQKKLKNAHTLNAYDLSKLDSDLASHFAIVIKQFIEDKNITDVDAIASHGHTVFHQPKNKFTLQIANPAIISALVNLMVIGDFRSADVALGGQGAPLVPIGDRDLFSTYKNRINLGGFANISFEKEDKTYAFDVCPANMALNEIANTFDLNYDSGGLIAEKGMLIEALLNQLNDLDYYKANYPKSLGIEWYINTFKPVLDNFKCSNEDKLRTLVEHISTQVCKVLIKGSVLISGGGAHNAFLVERIRANCSNEIILPESTIIDFKEAIIFAYLGHLRMKNKTNVLSSVTGASEDHCAGSIHIS